MSATECRHALRRLELDAYCSVVSALRAQGDLTVDKRRLLKDLQGSLRISLERHRAEVRRAVNDDRLKTIADRVSDDINISTGWQLEGRRLVPVLPRLLSQSTCFLPTKSSDNDKSQMNLDDKNVLKVQEFMEISSPVKKNLKSFDEPVFQNIVTIEHQMLDLEPTEPRHTSLSTVVNKLIPLSVEHTALSMQHQLSLPQPTYQAPQPVNSLQTVQSSQVVVHSTSAMQSTQNVSSQLLHVSSVPISMPVLLTRCVASSTRTTSHHIKSAPTPKVIIVSGTGMSTATTISGPPPPPPAAAVVTSFSSKQSPTKMNSLSVSRFNSDMCASGSAVTSAASAISVPHPVRALGSTQRLFPSRTVPIIRPRLGTLTARIRTCQPASLFGANTIAPAGIVATVPSPVNTQNALPLQKVISSSTNTLTSQGLNIQLKSVTLRPPALQIRQDVEKKIVTHTLPASVPTSLTKATQATTLVKVTQTFHAMTSVAPVAKVAQGLLATVSHPSIAKVVQNMQAITSVAKVAQNFQVLSTTPSSSQPSTSSLSVTKILHKSLPQSPGVTLASVGPLPTKTVTIQSKAHASSVSTSSASPNSNVLNVDNKLLHLTSTKPVAASGGGRIILSDSGGVRRNVIVVQKPVQSDKPNTSIDINTSTAKTTSPFEKELVSFIQRQDLQQTLPVKKFVGSKTALETSLSDVMVTTTSSSTAMMLPFFSQSDCIPASVTDYIADCHESPVSACVKAIKQCADISTDSADSEELGHIGDLSSAEETRLLETCVKNWSVSASDVLPVFVEQSLVDDMMQFTDTDNSCLLYQPQVEPSYDTSVSETIDNIVCIVHQSLSEGNESVDHGSVNGVAIVSENSDTNAATIAVDEQCLPEITGTSCIVYQPPSECSNPVNTVHQHETSANDNVNCVQQSATTDVVLAESIVVINAGDIVTLSPVACHLMADASVSESKVLADASVCASLDTEVETLLNVDKPVISDNVSMSVVPSDHTELQSSYSALPMCEQDQLKTVDNLPVDQVELLVDDYSLASHSAVTIGCMSATDDISQSPVSGLGKRKRKPPHLSDELESPSSVTGWNRQALLLLNRVMKLRSLNGDKNRSSPAAWFNQPVDADEVPDYYDIIIQPMDFGTIKKKLETGMYSDWSSFNADMLLVRDNCQVYNAVGTQVRHDCDLVFNFYQQELLKTTNKVPVEGTSCVAKKMKFEQTALD